MVLEGFNLSGFRGELVAVGGIAGNVIDLFITLEDTIGRRLDNPFTLLSYLVYGQHPHVTQGWPQFSEIIDRTGDGIVTIHNRYIFAHSVSGQELTFRLQYIYYNNREGTQALDIDLSTLTPQQPAAWLWDTPLLPTYLHDIPITLAGFEAAGGITLSGVGILNGRLHIQEQYDQQALSRWTGNSIQLINPYGEIVPPIRSTYNHTATVSFRVDPQGHFYNDRGYNFVVDFPFREFVYDVDLTRLAEYRLVAALNVYDTARLQWRASFTIEMPRAQEIILSDLNLLLEQYEAIIREIRITPLTVFILAHDLRDDGVWLGLAAGTGSGVTRAQVQLVTNDSAAYINVQRWVVMLDTDSSVFMEHMVIGRDPVDLNSLVTVLIDGETLIEMHN